MCRCGLGFFSCLFSCWQELRWCLCTTPRGFGKLLRSRHAFSTNPCSVFIVRVVFVLVCFVLLEKPLVFLFQWLVILKISKKFTTSCVVPKSIWKISIQLEKGMHCSSTNFQSQYFLLWIFSHPSLGSISIVYFYFSNEFFIVSFFCKASSSLSQVLF